MTTDKFLPGTFWKWVNPEEFRAPAILVRVVGPILGEPGRVMVTLRDDMHVPVRKMDLSLTNESWPNNPTPKEPSYKGPPKHVEKPVKLPDPPPRPGDYAAGWRHPDDPNQPQDVRDGLYAWKDNCTQRTILPRQETEVTCTVKMDPAMAAQLFKDILCNRPSTANLLPAAQLPEGLQAGDYIRVSHVVYDSVVIDAQAKPIKAGDVPSVQALEHDNHLRKQFRRVLGIPATFRSWEPIYEEVKRLKQYAAQRGYRDTYAPEPEQPLDDKWVETLFPAVRLRKPPEDWPVREFVQVLFYSGSAARTVPLGFAVVRKDAVSTRAKLLDLLHAMGWQYTVTCSQPEYP